MTYSWYCAFVFVCITDGTQTDDPLSNVSQIESTEAMDRFANQYTWSTELMDITTDSPLATDTLLDDETTASKSAAINVHTGGTDITSVTFPNETVDSTTNVTDDFVIVAFEIMDVKGE